MSGVHEYVRSKPCRRIDPIPREFSEQLHDVGLAPERTLEDRREIEFVNAGNAAFAPRTRGTSLTIYLSTRASAQDDRIRSSSGHHPPASTI